MAQHTLRATCRRTAFDEIECTIPYHAELIAAWKDAVPSRNRNYDPDTKAWRFLGDYRDLAIGLVVQYFPAAEVPNRSRSQAHGQSHPAGSDHFRILHLRETAPVELIEASYRVLARLYHPDRGGTHEAMQELNGAYAALRERVSA
jgi:hypothetical protein